MSSSSSPVDVRGRLRALLDGTPDDAQAIEFDRSWLTWADVRRTCRSITGGLDAVGSPPDGRVAVVLETTPAFLCAVIAVLASDRCVVTASPLQPPARLADDLRASAVDVVVVSAEVAGLPEVQACATTLVVLAEDGATVVRTVVGATGETSPGVAIEMLTSGTTGPPKRVKLSDRQLEAAITSSGWGPEDGRLLRNSVRIVATPLVHIGGIWGALSTVLSGRRLCLLPKFDVDVWADAVDRLRPPTVGLVPAAIRSILDADVDAAILADLKAVTVGAAFCPADLAQEFTDRYGVPVLSVYGATEFAGAVAGWSLPMHAKYWGTKRGSVGRALKDVEICAVSEDGAVLPTGSSGLIAVRTPQSAVGREEWTRTSDRGYVDADGFVWLEGRVDDAIIRGGFKVHPNAVIAALESHPAVLEAAVLGLPDERLGQVPVAAVELAGGADEVDGEALRRHCRQTLTPYEVPVKVVVVDALPRTPSSKVSRTELSTILLGAMAATNGA